MEEVKKQEMQDFVIDTKIYVKDKDHLKFDVKTNVNESDPSFFENEDVVDPNMLLFFFWTQALAGCVGIESTEARDILASNLFEIICETEHKAVACRAIEKIQKLPTVFVEEPETDDGLPYVGERFINTKIRYTEDRQLAHISVESDVPKPNPDEKKNKLLLFYWTRAVADCAFVLQTRAEKEYLAQRLYDTLMEADESTLLAEESLDFSINDGLN